MTEPKDMNPIELGRPDETHLSQAAAWFVRLDQFGPQTAVRTEFADWCAADPMHEPAFEQIRDLWETLAAPATILAAVQAKRYKRLIDKARCPSSPRFLWQRPYQVLAGAVATLALVLAFWLALPLLTALAQNMVADASTGPGERRTLSLPDGSMIELAGNSAVAFTFDETQRHVTLLRGEGFFMVRPDTTVPFLVDAGAGWARVIGTRFDVRRGKDEVDVTVAEGRVAIGITGSVEGPTLTSGMQAVIETGPGGIATVTPVAATDLTRALAWRQDRLVFKRETLAAVVAELAANSGRRIVIWRPEYHDLRISGTFPTYDTDITLDAIADTLALNRLDMTPWLTVLY